MIGQEKLKSKLNNINLNNFPHSLILSGSVGCGKHLYCKEISTKLGLPLIDISNNISKEYIDDIYMSVEPTIYMIDSSIISKKDQNIILKFLEEPLNISFIIIICNQESQLLGTIKNRCQIWRFESYSEEELSNFNPDNFLFQGSTIFNTPGKRMLLKDLDVSPYVDLVGKMLTKIQVASVPNTLSIQNKIAFKDEKDKLNLRIFQLILQEKAYQFYKELNLNYDILLCINDYINKSYIPRVDQKILLDNFLIDLWSISRKWN